jgi:hypothetical protein
MSVRRLATAVCVLALVMPATAWAGAPNYDCFVTGGRVTIDQWSGVLATSGFEHRPARWGGMSAIDQNGSRLDLTAVLRGTSVVVAVRGTGSSLRITEAGRVLAGRCVFIPGYDVVRRSDRGGSVLRSAPAAASGRILAIPRGTPVWQDSRVQPHGHWLAVRTVVFEHGAISTVDGWLRQARPPISRDIAGSPDY